MEAQSKIVVITLDGEAHSKRPNPKTVITMSYENSSVQKCSVYLGPQMNMKQFGKLFRKRPVEKDCVGVNHKRKKNPHIQGECSNDAEPSDLDDLPSNSNNQKRFKHKHEPSNNLLGFNNCNSKGNSDFIKHPSINNLTDLLNSMHYESSDYTHSNSSEYCKNEQPTASSQRKCLFSFCLKKFCEYCEQDHLTKKSRRSKINHFKLFKQLRSAIIRRAQCRRSVRNINSLRNFARTNNKNSLTNRRRLHQPNSLYSMSNHHKITIRRCGILLGDEFHKYFNCKNDYNKITDSNSSSSYQSDDDTVCINFYHIGTTNRKQFMDIVTQYKKMKKKIDKTSVSDIDCPYRDLIEPDVLENIEINDSIIEDSNLSSTWIDDFILDDLDMTPKDKIGLMWTIPSSICHSSTAKSTTTTVNLEPETSIDKLEKKNEETASTNVEKVTTTKQEQDILEVTTSTSLSEEKETTKNNSEEKIMYLKILNELNIKEVLTVPEKAIITSMIFTDYSVNNSNWETYKVFLKPLITKFVYYFESYKFTLSNEISLEYIRGSKAKEGGLIDIEMLFKSIQVDASLLEQYFTYAKNKNVLIWPMSEGILNIVSPDNPVVSILINFVKNILNKICQTVIDYLQKSGQTIVLNRESLFESLYCFPIEKHVLNTETSLEDVNVSTDTFSTDVPDKSNTENIDLIDDTTFCIKKNSSNEEICKRMVDILKSNDSNHQFWEKCNNSQKFLYKLSESGIKLPIEDENILAGSTLIKIYIKWFIDEFVKNNNFNNLAVSILKNIVLHLNTEDKCIKQKQVEVALNYALVIFYYHPEFSEIYKAYNNAKNNQFLSSNYIISNNQIHEFMANVNLNIARTNVFDVCNTVEVHDSIYSIPENRMDSASILTDNTFRTDLIISNTFEQLNEGIINNTLDVGNDDNLSLEADLVGNSSGINLDFESTNNTEDIVLASSFDGDQKDFIDIGHLDLNDELLCFDNGNKMFD